MLPIGKTLDISTAGNWELAWAGIRSPTEQDKLSYRLNRRWLPAFDIPVLIESPVIAIKASSANAKPTWSSAGTLLRLVSFPKDEITIEDEFPGLPTAVIDKRYIRLNSDFEVLIFNQSSDTLQLSFIPKPWIFSIGIVVYAYKGPINDEILEQLAAVRAKLETIDSQVG